ncbi:MAG: sigma-54 dependent transcriptional regulator [Nitrospirota bacterium]
MRYSILIVEDDKMTRESLAKALTGSYIIHTVNNGIEALSLLNKENIDAIITDVKMPLMDGMEMLDAVKKTNPDIIVIMVTGYATVESAVDAMKKGVYDYITKPVNIERLHILIEKAFENRRLKTDNTILRRQLKETFSYGNIIGNSKKIREIINLISQISTTKATVLILGESGTGKELIANAIHYNSPAADGPFIKVSCAALAEGILESELFGHEKGAFTGAIHTKKGRFELADRGTLFLDEVGDIPLPLQVKLLRVLQEQEFERVGGVKTLKVDARVIAATNKKLDEMAKEGNFREELYYRLKVVTIDVPPLRERKEDIPLLSLHFLNHFRNKHKKVTETITPDAMRLLTVYDWPGNIRELMNCIESATVMTRGEIISAENLPSYLLKSANTDSTTSPGRLFDIEKKVILETLSIAKGNKVLAARMLGIGLRTLYRKLNSYDIPHYKHLTIYTGN